jgi:hypothetical protein
VDERAGAETADGGSGEPPPRQVAPDPTAWPAAPDPLFAIAAPSGWVVPKPRAEVRFRSARLRSQIAIGALVLVALIDLLELSHYLAFGGLVESYAAGTSGLSDLRTFDDLTTGIAWLNLAALVACGLVYLAWLSRAVENAPAIGAGIPPHGPRGAIGWWFAPFANWFVPYRIVADLHDRLGTASDHGRARVVVLGWWLVYVLSGLLGYLGVLLSFGETLDDVRLEFTAYELTDAVQIVAAILAIVVILRIQRREDARAAVPKQPGGEVPVPVPVPIPVPADPLA